MASLRRYTHGLVPFLLLGSCAQLIGLSDYDTGQANDEGGGGEADSGGTGGSSQGGASGSTAAKPGVGGEDDGGQGGTIAGRPPRGGTTGDGGMAGEPDGGDGGKGGTTTTGGTATGGTSGASGAGDGGSSGSGATGGSGGSPVCTEISLSMFVGAIVDPTLPAVGAYYFEVDPELGDPFTDTFEVQFWDSGSAGTTYDGALLGSFMLGPPGPDSNYAFCSRCLIVRQDEMSSREKTFFQTEGTITLTTTSDQMNGFPNWTIDDVTLREVIIDTDQISTVVPGGACLHITNHNYVREAPTNWVCNLAWYSDGDCDCGCGQLDQTCTSTSASVCDYCWCNVAETCTPNEVVASSNWLCN
jgi:hypothetical protein